jgi:hypothetical protein
VAGLLATGSPRSGAAEPNDPLYPFQWPLDNTGQLYPWGCDPNSTCVQGTPDADIDWREAWEAGASGSGVIVAVGSPCSDCTELDGDGLEFGPTVKCQNGDLAGRLWVNPGESGGGKETNGIDDDGNGFVDDVHGANVSSDDGDVCLPGTSDNHDTNVAQLAVGEVDGLKAVGVAPGAQLMLLNGWGDTIGTFFTEVLDYAGDHGVRVIVVPYTGWVSTSGPFQNQSECAAFGNPAGPPNWSRDLSRSEALVFCGFADEFPGCDPSAVGLGYTNSNDVAQNAGTPFLDIAAPGERGWLSGVALSWALPMAGGTAALALDRNPGLTRAALFQRLMDAADKVGDPNAYDPNGWSADYGFGRINAYRTLLHGDLDLDGIDGDGDGSGDLGDGPCAPGASAGCDDNCPALANPTQENGDLDGIGDICDNCPDVGNADQLDSGGLLGPVPDGDGDACQCGDANGDGLVNAADISAAQLCDQGLGPCLPTCDADSSGSCSAADISPLESALAGTGALSCIIL